MVAPVYRRPLQMKYAAKVAHGSHGGRLIDVDVQRRYVSREKDIPAGKVDMDAEGHG